MNATIERLKTAPAVAHDGTAEQVHHLALSPDAIRFGLGYYYGTVTDYGDAVHVETIPDGPYCADCTRHDFDYMYGTGCAIIIGDHSDVTDPDNEDDPGCVRSCAACFQPIA